METNTFNKGQVRVVVYKERDNEVWYATALELNLTVDSDNKSSVVLELEQAVVDYIQSAQEIGDVTLLNQTPDPEILELWEKRMNNQTDSIESPYIPFSASIERLGA